MRDVDFRDWVAAKLMQAFSDPEAMLNSNDAASEAAHLAYVGANAMMAERQGISHAEVAMAKELGARLFLDRERYSWEYKSFRHPQQFQTEWEAAFSFLYSPEGMEAHRAERARRKAMDAEPQGNA